MGGFRERHERYCRVNMMNISHCILTLIPAPMPDPMSMESRLCNLSQYRYAGRSSHCAVIRSIIVPNIHVDRERVKTFSGACASNSISAIGGMDSFEF